MVPDQWQGHPLGDLLNLSSGKRPALSDDASVPVYGGNGLMGWTEEPLVTTPTVVIGRVGSVGTIHRTDGPVWISDNALYVREHSDDVTIDFLPWLLDFERLDRFATRSSHPSLSQRAVSQVRVDLPSLPEQRKIAAILYSVDDAIAATRKVIEQTKRVKQGLLQTLMTRGIGHTRFRKTEIGALPEAWEVVKLKDVGEIVTGSTPPTSEKGYWGGSMPFVTPGEVPEDTPELQTTERYLTAAGVEKGRTVPPRSVLVVCIGSSIGKVGLSAVEVAFNQQINAIVPRVRDEWFLYGACSQLMPLMREVTGRQAVPIINKTSFSNLPIPWPRAEERERIGHYFQRIQASIGAHTNTVTQLQTLKRGLMQDLLTGRVRVPLA